MRLEFKLVRTKKAKHGMLLMISRKGNENPFVYAKPFDNAHAVAIRSRFEAWGKQGWPYEPKG